MGKSRKTKPPGLIPFYLPSMTPGPLGHNDAGHPNSPRWLLGDTPGSSGINDHNDPSWARHFGGELQLDPEIRFHVAYWMINPFAANIVFVTEADEAEFNLLKRKIEDRNVAEYVNHRNAFFGSTAAYHEYAAESDKELDETKGLRKKIELHGAAQTVFYRWVRRAYEKNGIEDVPAVIFAGKTEELKKQLAGVKANYKGDFKHGGFNPRPKKKNSRYRLGTISEHATGMAIDIEDDHNPQLVLEQWQFITKFTGKTVDLSLSRWKTNPKGMWQDVKDLNDRFVAKVQEEVKRIQDEREKSEKEEAAAASGDKPKPSKKDSSDPLDEIFKGSKDIKKLKKWAGGFFTLEWELVEQLHKHTFRWGATFYPGNVDLHHFELSEKTD